MLFTAARKLELATVLKEGMQDRRLAIPAGDPVLRADLHAIRSRVGPTGIRRLVAEGDTDGHADRFWALALATGAAEAAPMEYGYEGVPGLRSRFAGSGDEEEDLADGRWGRNRGAW